MSSTYTASKYLYLGEGVGRYSESAVPSLLSSGSSRSAGGTVSALVRRPGTGKPLTARPDFCCWVADRLVPPRQPCHYQSALFTWDLRSSPGCTQVAPRKEKLAWWLTLPKVTNCSWGLQETSPPDDLLI